MSSLTLVGLTKERERESTCIQLQVLFTAFLKFYVWFQNIGSLNVDLFFFINLLLTDIYRKYVKITCKKIDKGIEKRKEMKGGRFMNIVMVVILYYW